MPVKTGMNLNLLDGDLTLPMSFGMLKEPQHTKFQGQMPQKLKRRRGTKRILFIKIIQASHSRLCCCAICCEKTERSMAFTPSSDYVGRMRSGKDSGSDAPPPPYGALPSAPKQQEEEVTVVSLRKTDF